MWSIESDRRRSFKCLSPYNCLERRSQVLFVSRRFASFSLGFASLVWSGKPNRNFTPKVLLTPKINASLAPCSTDEWFTISEHQKTYRIAIWPRRTWIEFILRLSYGPFLVVSVKTIPITHFPSLSLESGILDDVLSTIVRHVQDEREQEEHHYHILIEPSCFTSCFPIGKSHDQITCHARTTSSSWSSL